METGLSSIKTARGTGIENSNAGKNTGVSASQAVSSQRIPVKKSDGVETGTSAQAAVGLQGIDLGLQNAIMDSKLQLDESVLAAMLTAQQNAQNFLTNPPMPLTNGQIEIIQQFLTQVKIIQDLNNAVVSKESFDAELAKLQAAEDALNQMSLAVQYNILDASIQNTVADLLLLKKDLENLLEFGMNMTDEERAQVQTYLDDLTRLLNYAQDPTHNIENLADTIAAFSEQIEQFETIDKWFHADEYTDIEAKPTEEDARKEIEKLPDFLTNQYGEEILLKKLAELTQAWEEREFNWAVQNTRLTFEEIYSEPQPPVGNISDSTYMAAKVQYELEKKKFWELKERYDWWHPLFVIEQDKVKTALDAAGGDSLTTEQTEEILKNLKPKPYDVPRPTPPNAPRLDPESLPRDRITILDEKEKMKYEECRAVVGACNVETEASKENYELVKGYWEQWEAYDNALQQYERSAFEYSWGQPSLYYGDVVPPPDKNNYTVQNDSDHCLFLGKGSNQYNFCRNNGQSYLDEAYAKAVERYSGYSKNYVLNAALQLKGEQEVGTHRINEGSSEWAAYADANYGPAFQDWNHRTIQIRKVGIAETINDVLDVANITTALTPLFGEETARKFQDIVTRVVPGAAVLDDVIRDVTLLITDPETFFENMGTEEWWIKHGTMAAQEAFKALAFNPLGIVANIGAMVAEETGALYGGAEGRTIGGYIGAVLTGGIASGQGAARLGGSAMSQIGAGVGGAVGGVIGGAVGQKLGKNSKYADEIAFWAATAGGLAGGFAGSKTPSLKRKINETDIDGEFIYYDDLYGEIPSSKRARLLDEFETFFDRNKIDVFSNAIENLPENLKTAALNVRQKFQAQFQSLKTNFVSKLTKTKAAVKDYRRLKIEVNEWYNTKKQNVIEYVKGDAIEMSSRERADLLFQLEQPQISIAKRMRISVRLFNDVLARKYNNTWGKLKGVKNRGEMYENVESLETYNPVTRGVKMGTVLAKTGYKTSSALAKGTWEMRHAAVDSAVTSAKIMKIASLRGFNAGVSSTKAFVQVGKLGAKALLGKPLTQNIAQQYKLLDILPESAKQAVKARFDPIAETTIGKYLGKQYNTIAEPIGSTISALAHYNSIAKNVYKPFYQAGKQVAIGSSEIMQQFVPKRGKYLARGQQMTKANQFFDDRIPTNAPGKFIRAQKDYALNIVNAATDVGKKLAPLPKTAYKVGKILYEGGKELYDTYWDVSKQLPDDTKYSQVFSRSAKHQREYALTKIDELQNLADTEMQKLSQSEQMYESSSKVLTQAEKQNEILNRRIFDEMDVQKQREDLGKFVQKKGNLQDKIVNARQKNFESGLDSMRDIIYEEAAIRSESGIPLTALQEKAFEYYKAASFEYTPAQKPYADIIRVVRKFEFANELRKSYPNSYFPTLDVYLRNPGVYNRHKPQLARYYEQLNLAYEVPQNGSVFNQVSQWATWLRGI